MFDINQYLKDRAEAKRARRAARNTANLAKCPNYVFTRKTPPDVDPLIRSVHAKMCREAQHKRILARYPMPQ